MGGLQRRTRQHRVAVAQRESRREPGARGVQFHARAETGIHGWSADGRLLERDSQQRRRRIWRQRLRQHGRRRGAAGKKSRPSLFAATDLAAARSAISQKSLGSHGWTVWRRVPRSSISWAAGRDARLSIEFTESESLPHGFHTPTCSNRSSNFAFFRISPTVM